LLFRLRSRERLPRRTSKLGDSISEKLTEYFGHTYYKDLEKLAEKYTVLAYHCDYREKPGDCKLRFAAVPVQS